MISLSKAMGAVWRMGLAACMGVAAVPATALVIPSGARGGMVTLAPWTQLVLAPAARVTSARLRRGDRFDVTVVRDVMVGDVVVIPAGTPGHAQVSWRTARSGFGKTGKFAFDLTDISIDGMTVPLRGGQRIEGRDNDRAMTLAYVGFGLIGAALVTGHSAVADTSDQFTAYTTAAMPVALPMQTAAFAGAAAALGGVLEPRLVSAGAPRVSAAPTPSGYCYDVPRDYAGTGSAKLPVLTRVMPGCFEVSGGR